MKQIIKLNVLILIALLSSSCNDDEEVLPNTIFGCTDVNAFNYNSNATSNDGSCCYIQGCTDVNASNYDSDACLDDGSCAYSNLGCTNEEAINYNPNATEDDGSCIILGCIDEFATNFNPNATNDDGSCEYSTEFLFYGNWDILTLEYSTEIDLSGIPTVGTFLGTQEIDGEANNAGSWTFLNDNSFENNISFQTEPINVATFEVPGFPIDFSSSGTWEIQNDDLLVIVDNTTSTISNYNILSIQSDVAFLSGTIPFSQEIMGFSFELALEVEMQLIKQ